ncbi:MAG: hypothetical protein FJW68_09935 [Actinobacteria bacterium]|nr:hypothetical protein [Actinomycetota bacterium]
MLLAEVIGSIYCTIKVESIKNTKLKIVKLLNPDGTFNGSYSIVEDAINAGTGEKVLIAEDEIAIANILNGKEDIPIRFCIVSKVDNIHIFKNE